MKRILALIIISFFFFSCKNSSQSNVTDEQSQIVKKEDITGKVIPITESEYKTLVYDFEKNPQEWTFCGDKPCVIDCYAEWCGPCRKLSPTLDSLAQKYAGKVNFYKINVDQAQQLSMMFGIKSIPMVFFCKKDVLQYLVGLYPPNVYQQAIDSLLLEKTNF